MRPTQEIRFNLEDGIDRQTLRKLKQRFLKLNSGRLQRAMTDLSPRQQTALKLFPLLFHVNHPLLPGYVSGLTPAGIAQFEPDEDILAEAQRLTRSFAYKTNDKRRRNQPQPIHGLFLMGSLGTLAQAEQSDMDIWVCHASDLSAHELEELQKKCLLLEAWANSQGAEAHFFLIDPNRFTTGERETRLSADDCGTTQHYLLLDEFYRTAIWLAGRTPIWWLVPVADESRYDDYTKTLLAKRFINADESLDIGHLAHIPAGEFVGAGMWQLFKGIEAPYKSLLKLLLIEVYAAEQPQLNCLSLRFKQAVFNHQVDLNDLDPYIVLYRRIEEYLIGRHEHARLELVRRSLYMKANKKLTKPPTHGRKSWQRLLLEQLTAHWGWDYRHLAELDRRQHWKIRQVDLERQALVNELNDSYRFLVQLARQQEVEGLISKRDLSILGRRLNAAFERKAGKVEFVNPGISADLSEANLTLVHESEPTSGMSQWTLYSESLSNQEWLNFAPLKRGWELIELLAWAYRNGVLESNTRITLYPGESDLTEFELFNLLNSLRALVKLPLANVEESALLRPSAPREIGLFVNVGVDPLRHHRDLNILMTTARTDPLSYAGVRENLVLTLDQVTLNTWNEMFTARYDTEYALFDCLRDYLNTLPANRELPNLTVRCFCHNRAPTIAQRVEEIFHTAQHMWIGNLHPRYILQVQQAFHVLEFKPAQVEHVALADVAALVAYLSQPTPYYSPIYVDGHALEGSDLALILPLGQPDCIQVFYRIDRNMAELYVLDEHNALWQQHLPFYSEIGLLSPIQRFLDSRINRRAARLPLDDHDASTVLTTAYYQISPHGHERVRPVEARKAPELQLEKPFYAVQAIIEPASDGQLHVNLYCNEREFSQLEHGAQLYREVVRHILRQRRDEQRYRCYITDLDLSKLMANSTQSIVYLGYKAELELALNEALGDL